MADDPLPEPKPEPAPAPAETQAKDRADWIASISGQISFLSTGDRAALRRMELTQSRTADGTVVKLLAGAQVPPATYERDFDRWRLVAHVAATLSGTGAVRAHARSRRLGAALAGIGYSENRLMRLLSTQGEGLHDQVRRAARMLARERQPVNLWTVYDLVGADADKAQAARIDIAQAYYAARASAKEGTATDE